VWVEGSVQEVTVEKLRDYGVVGVCVFVEIFVLVKGFRCEIKREI
jgi:hypothetical protein